VIVSTKNNDDVQYIWESDSNSYSVVEDLRIDTPKALPSRSTSNCTCRVTNDFQEMMPYYLSLVRGVVDCDYLPLWPRQLGEPHVCGLQQRVC